MSEPSPTRRDVLATSAAAGAASLLPEGSAGAADGNAIRPFRIDVPEAKLVKNRIHLDVKVGPDNREAEHEKLLARGATFRYRQQQGPMQWITMADPEGNEFCLS